MNDNLKPITTGLLFDDLDDAFSLDGYEPRLAHDVITRATELSHDGYVLVLSFMVQVARMETGRN